MQNTVSMTESNALDELMQVTLDQHTVKLLAHKIHILF
jgi:hypothetical protein